MLFLAEKDRFFQTSLSYLKVFKIKTIFQVHIYNFCQYLIIVKWINMTINKGNDWKLESYDVCVSNNLPNLLIIKDVKYLKTLLYYFLNYKLKNFEASLGITQSSYSKVQTSLFD